MHILCPFRLVTFRGFNFIGLEIIRVLGLLGLARGQCGSKEKKSRMELTDTEGHDFMMKGARLLQWW